MANHVISPDGELMWTGSEWIPAPPKTSSPKASMLLQDSVIGGDVNITQSNPEDWAAATASVFERLGFSAQSLPDELNFRPIEKVADVPHVSARLGPWEIEINPQTKIILGNAANSLDNLAKTATKPGNLVQAARFQRYSLAIKREIGDLRGVAQSLGNLGGILQHVLAGDWAVDAHHSYTEAARIWRKIGDQDEAHRCDTEAAHILSEIGMTIDQLYGDIGH